MIGEQLYDDPPTIGGFWSGERPTDFGGAYCGMFSLDYEFGWRYGLYEEGYTIGLSVRPVKDKPKEEQ
jgi:hypothetical protein